MLDLLDTTKHLQALTHYMGLYFMASRGAKLVGTCRDPGLAREGEGNAKSVSIDTRIRVYLASVSGTNISRNTDPGAAAHNTLAAASVSRPGAAVGRGTVVALVPAVFVPLPCVSRCVV